MAFAPAVWLSVQEELDLRQEQQISPEEDVSSWSSGQNYFDCFHQEELLHRFKLSRPCINFITDYFSSRLQKQSQGQMKQAQMYKAQMKDHSAARMMMVALDFYSNGLVSTLVQDRAGFSTIQTHEVISIVSKVISGAMNDFVTFPKTRDSRANVANDIKNFCGIPNVLGVVACLHVKVKLGPDRLTAELFRNSLDYHSTMTQVICDCEGNFLSVEDCRVGSTPEQNIWESSAIGEQFVHGAHGASWIIGGSGYSLSSHLLTAVSLVTTEPERRFNAAHAAGLRAMQETLTSLKRRFRCLTNLGYSQQDDLDKKADVINACCVLHNIAKKFSAPSLLDAGLRLEPQHPGALFHASPGMAPYQAAKARDDLICAHFSGPSSDLNLTENWMGQ